MIMSGMSASPNDLSDMAAALRDAPMVDMAARRFDARARAADDSAGKSEKPTVGGTRSPDSDAVSGMAGCDAVEEDEEDAMAERGESAGAEEDSGSMDGDAGAAGSDAVCERDDSDDEVAESYVSFESVLAERPTRIDSRDGIESSMEATASAAPSAGERAAPGAGGDDADEDDDTDEEEEDEDEEDERRRAGCDGAAALDGIGCDAFSVLVSAACTRSSSFCNDGCSCCAADWFATIDACVDDTSMAVSDACDSRSCLETSASFSSATLRRCSTRLSCCATEGRTPREGMWWRKQMRNAKRVR